MKKVLCDKDGEFISIHDEDYYLMELNDGDYLTHEDGTILIYRECKRRRHQSSLSCSSALW